MYMGFPSITAYRGIQILPSKCLKSSNFYFFGIYVKNKVDSMFLASKSDTYSLLSLLAKFRQFFQKIDFFEKIDPNFICGAGVLDIKTTTGPLGGRIGPNPDTWICILVYSDGF